MTIGISFIKTHNFIREKIKKTGRISSKDFIDICLYGNNGYYTYTRNSENVYFKDYATAPLTHPAFGFLISILICNLIESFNTKEKIVINEFGAGNGTLAYDVSKSLNLLGYKNFKYNAIDKLNSDSVTPIISIDEKKSQKQNGIILANELFDALPHHLFVIKKNKLYEKYVELKGDKFIEVLDRPSDNCIQKRISLIEENIDNSTGEIFCEKNSIFDLFKSNINKGYILTIDYGMSENNLFFKGKKNSNISVINNHNFYKDYFYKPGFSDITFQVDTKELFRNYNSINFSNNFITTQREFLFELGIGEILKKLSLSKKTFEEINLNRFAINQLIKPNGMGNYFVSLHSNFNNDFSLNNLNIKKKFFDEIPYIKEFPQRFELPWIYKKNNIIKEDWIK